jgi:hypothetical protein
MFQLFGNLNYRYFQVIYILYLADMLDGLVYGV